MDHPHIHCVVSGGGLAQDGGAWVSCRRKFFLPVRMLSALFKGKFLDYLGRGFDAGELALPGALSPPAFATLRRQLYRMKWVVYCKPPFNGAKGAIQYLSRYTHGIAIGNHRILGVEHDRVSFRWRDYADGNKDKVMTLDAPEFIRRFLLHVLPARFVRIRYYGLWGNRNRKAAIARCRMLIGNGIFAAPAEAKPEPWQSLFLRLTGIDLSVCPVCQKGRMHRTGTLMPSRCNSPPPRLSYA